MYDIGSRIKALRTKNGLTLEELGSRTELTKGFLSQLERNLTSPSLPTLEDIVEALGVSMSKFFADDDEEQIVFTKEDTFVDEQEERTINWIVPNAQKNKMEPLILELKPGCSSKEIEPYDGEEFGYVLQGRIQIRRESDSRKLIVKKGETFYIKGNESHSLVNTGQATAKVLWISTPPIF
ncbi:MAG: XRE family transcriptional regulator [Erysipelotrichaceae bacterium]|nr:XRE family transcriptional regulator [Erysipelotrichaceae bacterium]MDO5120513.1 XRE family transcriptional regulator [Erysipelotrichaceae bacterium]